jgi:hypothetical protein
MLWLHGFGVSICSARGCVRWGGEAEDYDAVECISFCFMPIIPFRVVHVSHNTNHLLEENKETQYFPIRYDWKTIFVAMARRWLWGFIVLGCLCFLSLVEIRNRQDPTPIFITAACFIGLGLTGHRILNLRDIRSQNIRYILGRHRFGSSDPTDWKAIHFENAPSAIDLYGTSTFAEAIPKLVANREYSRAMWAARLTVAIENDFLGEEWTDLILGSTEVQLAVRLVRSNPFRWYSQMVGSNEKIAVL